MNRFPLPTTEQPIQASTHDLLKIPTGGAPREGIYPENAEGPNGMSMQAGPFHPT
jgi:hypothetical protein